MSPEENKSEHGSVGLRRRIIGVSSSPASSLGDSSGCRALLYGPPKKTCRMTLPYPYVVCDVHAGLTARG